MLGINLVVSRQSCEMFLVPSSLHVLIFLLCQKSESFQLLIPTVVSTLDVEEKLSLHSLADLVFPSAGTCL